MNGDDVLQQTKQKSLRLCRQFLGGVWNKVSFEKFHFEPICGGLSNYLYMCSLPEGCRPQNGEPQQVLVRMYGEIIVENTEFIVNDCVVFALLSERQFGPKLYGVFQGGRVEEYIDSRALQTTEIWDPQISSIVAGKLAQMHKLQMPTKKEPHYIFENAKKWLDEGFHGLDLSLLPPDRVDMYKKIHSYNLHKEMMWLQKFLTKVPSPVVFCHNDLQEGNILYVNRRGEDKSCNLVLIDFEYAHYNYRGFDIGNHFCEWMYDYSNKTHPYFYTTMENFPTREQQELFLSAYLNEMGEIVTPAVLHDMLIEVNTFSLAAEFMWGAWALTQALLSKIEFGYLEYALSRFEIYFKHKQCLPILAETGSFTG